MDMRDILVKERIWKSQRNAQRMYYVEGDMAGWCFRVEIEYWNVPLMEPLVYTEEFIKSVKEKIQSLWISSVINENAMPSQISDAIYGMICEQTNGRNVNITIYNNNGFGYTAKYHE